ncbi:MAG: Uma2 family endonuclease [Acidobacteria bacterium]|nr:Uma2 family endonuclease [Acidobacteriota bacterium]
MNKDAARSARNIEHHWHLCPPFIIEVRPQSDRLVRVRLKMEEGIENGTQFGWLLDPGQATSPRYASTPSASKAKALSAVSVSN